MLSTTRQERRTLEAENRKWPAALRRVPDGEWSHIKSIGDKRKEVWRSRGFLVQVFSEVAGIERLTVCRTAVENDTWVAEISWDELQRLKAECGRGDRDAVEIYPADKDVVNVANMRHLWVMPTELPFKWQTKQLYRGARDGAVR